MSKKAYIVVLRRNEEEVGRTSCRVEGGVNLPITRKGDAHRIGRQQVAANGGAPYSYTIE